MLNKELILSAFSELDRLLSDDVNILIGGGAAILLLEIMPISTMDVDAMPFKSVIGPEELKPYREKIAKKLNLAPDWINEYFYQFTHCLPQSYGDRLKIIFKGAHVTCHILHPTDIAIMKLFAGREKDESHLRVLLGKGHADLSFIDDYISDAIVKNHPGAEKASIVFNRLIDALGL